MLPFCVIEGVDGTGKSHLANAVAEYAEACGRRDVTVVLKDSTQTEGDSWPDKRLREMHKLTWSYNKAEPVWEYSRQYWLFSILAWYRLFYEWHVEPHITAGRTVVTDGWYFKHQARFRLSDDEAFIRLSDDTLCALPQPDVVVFLDTPITEVASRKHGNSKPSEHGAFDSGLHSSDLESFIDYQQRSQAELLTVLDEHPASMYKVSHLINPSEFMDLIGEIQRSS